MEPRRMTAKERESLKIALRECKFIKDDDGVFKGEANGWVIMFGREDQGYVGYALGKDHNVQIELPGALIEKVLNRLLSIN
jgi:hypothetical protein